MKLIFAAAALLATTGISVAEDANRYSLEKTATGYVRMDNATGEMSICKEQAEQLICRIAADDRLALEDGISRLETRLAKVEEKLASLQTSGVTTNDKMPTDEEFEKTMGYMEKFFRRFMGVVKDLNESDTQPNKT
jgi:hypothetical protein